MRQGLLALLALGLASTGRAQERFDILIRGGSVYDGTGGAPRIADIGVRGERIVFVGTAPTGATATRTIDARGLVVAPGFIDPHTHIDDDLRDPAGRRLPGFLLQGVTTLVTGNDGASALDVGAARGRLAGGVGANIAFLIGHGSVRGAVMGMAARAPTTTELDSMKALVARAMRDGAYGLSTGLYYPPGSYSATDEVIALARVAHAAGGYYDSHIRDESSYTIGLLGAIDEAIAIGRASGIPIHISHIKALGVDVWGKSDEVIARILAARAAGIDVTADQYPYTASGTSVEAALVPRWAEAGGRDSLKIRLARAETRSRIAAEMTENLRRRGGAESLLITGGQWKGKRLSEIAKATGATPIDAAIAIVAGGDAGVASFNMNDGDIDRFMAQTFVVTGSDGSAGHPRKYGTFPKKLRHYVLDRGVISLARAIEASSRQTAGIVGLEGRGTLAPGLFADVVVFDSTTIADRATYEAPAAPAVGMRYVMVNGRLAVDQGKPTGILAGRALTRGTH